MNCSLPGKFRRFLVLSLACLVGIAAVHAEIAARDESYRTLSKLTETVLPLVETRDVLLEDLLQFSQLKYRAANPSETDFKIVLQPPRIPPLVLPGQKAPLDPAQQTISLNVQAIPLLELLKMVASLSNTKFRVQGKTVLFAWLEDKSAYTPYYEMEDWKLEAQRIFPDLRDPQKPFFQAVAAEADVKRTSDAAFFNDITWPLRLATIVSGRSGVNPEQRNPSVNPLEFTPEEEGASDAPTAPAHRGGLSPQDIAAAAMPSVFTVVITDAAGKRLQFGSGFLIKPNLIATNYHVIDNPGVGGGFIASEKSPQPIRINRPVLVDEVADLAILELAAPAGKPLVFAAAKDIQVGSSVYAIGSPEGLGGTFSSGLLSAFRNEEPVSHLQISAPISHGSSGGPVLDGQGNVIGIAVSGVTEGQNLNFAIPVEYLASLMEGKRGRRIE